MRRLEQSALALVIHSVVSLSSFRHIERLHVFLTIYGKKFFNMEILKEYASDTDEDEPPLGTNTIVQLMSDPPTSTEESEVNSPNYFGFQVFTKGHKKNLTHDKSQEEKGKKNCQHGEIEVPDSNFWKDFIPTNIPESESMKTSHSEYFKIQTGSSGLLTKRLSGNDISKISSNHKRSYKCTGNNYGIPQSKKQCMTTIPTKSNTQTAENMKLLGNKSEDVKKTMYYIHSKVAPYLNSQTATKCSSKLENSWCAHDGVINRLNWNAPNYSHLLATAGMDAAVRIWNVWSSTETAATVLRCHKKAVTYVDWCFKGLKILSCSYDRTSQVTDVETAQCVALCEHLGFVTSACVHPSNPNMFVSGTDNMICLWDVRTPQAPVKHFTYKDNIGQIQDILFTSNGQELISCCDLVCRDSADRSIMAWDLRSGVVLSNQIYQERFTCTRLKISPDHTHFLAQSQGDYIAIFSASSPYRLNKSKRYEGHKIQGYRIGFDISPDGRLVYSGSASGGVHCYDGHSGRVIRQLGCNRDIVTDVACHPVLSSLIAASTWGGRIYLFI
ncbi:WD repeat-containing protein 25 [Bulinus truncatus]|nr:WD repeat-containing protein 25 [Bulinus truncatus]